MKKILITLDACRNAKNWAGDKSWKEIYETCERGDWLLWLFKKTNPDDLQRLTLAKGHCAKTVIHLMKDGRSAKAVEVAILFGEGKATGEELNAAAADAADAAAYTDADAVYAAYAAVYTTAAADAAAYTAAAAAAAAVYTTVYTIAAYDATDAKKKNQMETADICRKYLPFEIWNLFNPPK
jgi:pyruvate-formate lyase-activating enzyme